MVFEITLPSSLLVRESAYFDDHSLIGFPAGHRISEAVQYRLINPISPKVGLSSTPKHTNMELSFQSPPFWCLMTTQQLFASKRENFILDVCMICMFAF